MQPGGPVNAEKIARPEKLAAGVARRQRKKEGEGKAPSRITELLASRP